MVSLGYLWLKPSLVHSSVRLFHLFFSCILVTPFYDIFFFWKCLFNMGTHWSRRILSLRSSILVTHLILVTVLDLSFKEVACVVPVLPEPTTAPPATASDRPFTVQVYRLLCHSATSQPATFLIVISYFLLTVFNVFNSLQWWKCRRRRARFPSPIVPRSV